MRFSASKRLLRSCSNADNTSFPDKSTSRVSFEMFSFPLMGDTLFVITSFVSGISASFLLKHLLMLIVVWCSASITRQSKLRVLSIMTTKRVDSFPTKGKKNSKNVYYHSHIIRTVTNKVNRTENFNESWTLF